LAAANSTVSGYLTSADWSTFNNKQAALSTASASVSGILSSADWSTFNGKQAALSTASASVSGILSSADWSTFNGKAPIASPTFTGTVTTPNTKFTGAYSANVISSTTSINCGLGNYFTVTGGAGTFTFSFSSAPASGNLYSMAIKMVNNGVAPTIVWPTSVRWPSGAAPATSSNTDIWVFLTDDGGSNWRGNLAMKDSR